MMTIIYSICMWCKKPEPPANALPTQISHGCCVPCWEENYPDIPVPEEIQAAHSSSMMSSPSSSASESRLRASEVPVSF